MASWPTSPSAIRARISSYRRILRQEAAVPGGFGDGYGKRYWLFYLYFLLRDDDAARAYIDWYRATFPNDIGDAGQFVCWALILHRLGREDEAIYRFVQAIDEKLPVVADLVDDLHAPYGIWGEELWEMYRVDADIRRAMSDEERAWLSSTWKSTAVVAMRERRIADGRAFAAATTREQREALSKEGRTLVEAFKPKEMPPLSAGMNWLAGGRTSAKRSSRKVIRTTPEIWARKS